MSLGELTGAADVSVRTVRYYIAEGLLPPPFGAGPTSAYTSGHLDRLRAIQRLKEAYLPLKEIRRQLSGLDDDEVRALLSPRDEEILSEDDFSPPDASLAGAREYLALMETRERYRTAPMALQTPPAASPSSSSPTAAPEPEIAATSLLSPSRPLPRAVALAMKAAPASEAQEGQDRGLWRHFALGEEAELVISDRIYARHRDRIDWLVRWARKVFG